MSAISLFFIPILSCLLLGAVLQSVGYAVFWVGKISSFNSSATVEKESYFLSDVLSSLARQVWARALKSPFDWTFWTTPSSEGSWLHNRDLLSQAPIASDRDRELILFLQQRWLAKVSGFFPLEVKWLCPFFGIQVQTHPETTNSYARDPGSCPSKTYAMKVKIWKRSLPHPPYFPLILARPSDIHVYLPNCLVISPEETIEAIVDQLMNKIKKITDLDHAVCGTNVIVDLTHFLPLTAKNRQAWLLHWKAFQILFSPLGHKHQLDLAKIFGIQRFQQGTIGGIRLLPLHGRFSKELALQHHVLSDWMSCVGLTANKIELDRSLLNTVQERIQRRDIFPSSPPNYLLEKEEFLSDLVLFHQNWKSSHPQKNLMVDATLQLLKGLIESEANWGKIFTCPTRSFIAKLSFFQIRKELEVLIKEQERSSFFDVASCIEQIHTNLSSLLEICLPFDSRDFPAIYRNLLVFLPPILKSFTQCGIHASGMTSLTGILRAVQQQAGPAFHVLYGENSYFEAVRAVSLVSKATCVLDATEEDWKEADLILTQFNPVLKRNDVQTEYRLEKTIEQLRAFLNAGREKPLTLAIDCTVDFLDSPRVRSVLELFQREIEEGTLNVICFRSGLKFDLLGMDNYCASPFFMIHNHSEAWTGFNLLLTDPVLQTDLLSLNWFCLAYKYAAPQLELYRKQVFDNTRALLNRIPPKLYEKEATYRVMPMMEGTDPAFIEMKVFGPLHRLRASAVLGGGLYLKCLKEKLPIFCRRSIGFYHANFGLLFREKSSSMRLTVGLDPAEVDTLAAC